MRSSRESILCLFAFILFSYAQTVEYSTDSSGNVYSSTVYDTATTSTYSYATTSVDLTSSSDYASSTIYTSYTTGSTNNAGTTTAYPPSTSVPAIQTVPFTGQALLVGTCNIAQFTMLTFPDGGSIEVPLVGCSDDRPECCPSLNLTNSGPEETGSVSQSTSTESSDGTRSISSWTATTPSPMPTGVMSMLSKAPLTVCPSDMTDIDPVCCPSGFQTYGQALVGSYPPCVSTLTTAITPDSAVLASITSAVAASLATATVTTTAAPTVSVIVTQVFALGLPCADNEADSHHGTNLSTGAKAGIGAGAGVLALLIIGFLWACLAVRHRRRAKMKRLEAANTAAGGPIRPDSTAYNASQDPKHLSLATTTTGMGSPMMQQQQQQQQQQPFGMGQPHGFSPAFGHYAPQGHDVYGQQHGVYPIAPTHGGGYPYSPGYPTNQSPPPPPFYPTAGVGGYQHLQGQYRAPAEVQGDEIHPGPGFGVGAGRQSTGLSEVHSEGTGTSGTLVGTHHVGPKSPAELSSQRSRQ